MTLSIHPSVGVARLGNSEANDFCVGPTAIGGLPYDVDTNYQPTGPVTSFKDECGRIRRQGQVFKLYDHGIEITLDSPNVANIEWTVHLANKKAAWYQYSELKGNLLYGADNSYSNQHVPFRNPNVADADRQSLIIDPGPRTVSGRLQSIEFDEASVPPSYLHPSFPTYANGSGPENGTAVTSLGTLKTDNQGRLIVLGGYGNAGGDEPLTSYGGSDSWHDDIADGSVFCTITYNDSTPSQTLSAWVIVGSPDFAPEIVNISTLNDTMFDVGVREKNLLPDMYSNGGYNSSYQANYQRDIEPIIKRIRAYQWVANVQSMTGFFANDFDFADNSEANKPNREKYYNYFRQLDPKVGNTERPQEQLYSEANGGQIPMMPLNSGSNSVSNDTIEKFLALDATQMFLLGQWADGKFDDDPSFTPYPVNPLDEASIGNCVGLPMCPGIEVTWSLQNPTIYAAPYTIAQEQGLNGYDNTGLTPSRDECEGGGCQPGDLTKRMACPWQADFFQCTIQYVNFTDTTVNKADKEVQIVTVKKESWSLDGRPLGETQQLNLTETEQTSQPLAPSYYSYWWPPQSPWDVLSGENTQQGQSANHLPAGQQINYARGINSFTQMVEHWSALAFIRDNNAANPGYAYFTETERNNELFSYKEVGIGQLTGNSADNETTIPIFFIDDDSVSLSQKGTKGKRMARYFEERAFKRVKIADGGLGSPRSGTRARR
ncbi:hypothetical protein H0A36_07455 [Endozoicomonas sp. SM1973]|uniref:L-lysine 6-oxidase n=1 Tax=Spartinivicinus marinus TaxID=2994442 RepID=A0A853I8F9_9GAMM|nr:CTQ-dependent lysine 6-oxidase LodA [Spartinivicinus marinus]MCX4029245.1 CTQ-dependent lysine 6-oxidase LodA [Spartinivicinus marinus]NYZ65847.1 hypothetical protein [Spartinivicinus marinus]